MQGFPDLRAEHSPAVEGEESFWPSFADIMMVVVMIFLISTASLIISNWGLTQQLTQTLESEKVANKQAELTLAENLTLEEQLAALENLLSISQLQRMRSDEEREKLEKELKILTEKLTRSVDISSTLETRLHDKTKEIQDLIAKLDSLEKEIEQARTEVDSKAKQLNSKLAELAAARIKVVGLESDKDQRDEAAKRAQTQFNITEESLSKLREEYFQLENKYEKLVRPARTTKGKYVVSLRYQRMNGEHRIQIKQPDESGFKQFSVNGMHTLLSALKAEHDDALYIRIIFPDNSKLTYKEAWGFTNEILNKYDYYNQNN